MNEAVLNREAAQKQRTLRLAQMAMLVAISSVLVFACFPIIPAAPHLKYDMANVPVLLAAFTLGTPSGLLVLTLAAAIQAFVLGHDGPIGFIMHMMASGTMVLVATSVCRALGGEKKGRIIGLAASCLAITLVMIPLNFIFTPKVIMDVPVGEATRLFIDSLSGGYVAAEYSEMAVTAYNAVKGLLWVGLVPFNLLKAGLNSVIFYLVYKKMGALIKK